MPDVAREVEARCGDGRAAVLALAGGLGMAGGGQEGSGNRQGVGDGVPPDGGRDSEARRKMVTALGGYGSPRGCGVPRQWQSEHCESDKVEADPIGSCMVG